MPHAIYLACTVSGRIDPATYVALHDEISLDGLYDLLEMREVHSSWESAALLNAEENADGE
jgi:hypothetical protein